MRCSKPSDPSSPATTLSGRRELTMLEKRPPARGFSPPAAPAAAYSSRAREPLRATRQEANRWPGGRNRCPPTPRATRTSEKCVFAESSNAWPAVMAEGERRRNRRRPPDTFGAVMLVTILVTILVRGGEGRTEFTDTLVTGVRTLTFADSPYLVREDVLVTREGELVIEPGVTMQFEQGVGITVRGILTAEGSPDKKITFTSSEMVGRQENRTIRLVDGPTVNQGIIQVMEKGKWRSVCTNSRNWTALDLGVACQQLGFTGGEWHHWYEHLNASSHSSTTKQLLYQDPGCLGHERTIEGCQWGRRKMGSGVCDHHPNLGILCLPFHHPDNRAVKHHWRGLRFESAPFSKRLTAENTLYVSYSKSVLSHVEVLNAGQGRWRGRLNVTSAIETWGVPPVMEYIKVENSAYNGINVTMPGSGVTISYANITGNRGYGVFLNSTRGDITLQHSSITNNMADGVKLHVHDRRPETKVIDGVDVHDFCTYSTSYTQTYPFLMVAEQYGDSQVSSSCGKKLSTKRGYILTLHFVHLRAMENEGATLEIRDGSDITSRLIATVPVRNFTRPESIVTTGNNMFITFSAKKKMKTEVFLEITAGLHKASDLNVTDTIISDNNGRGVLVEKMRSNIHIHQTTVQRNNYVAGVNVKWGSGYVNITHSKISQNYVDGVNITYGGGCQNISWSEIEDNVGLGVGLWINETTINTPVRQEFDLAYSNISLNYDIGVLVGNFCGPSIVNVSGNYFESGRYVGLEVLSCWRDSILEGVLPGLMNLQVGHNHFQQNAAVALKLAPLARAVGKIEHNDFLANRDGAVYIHNTDDYILEIQKVDLLMQENRFLRNHGSYVVNLGLSHYDFKQGQKLLMNFNWLRDNVIVEPWLRLNPRSKVAAPVVISSNNVRVERNILENPESRYEIGSHLIEPNTEIDCRHNWIGDKDEKVVWSKIFDRDDRYNLAKISYIPYLLSNNINTELVLERPLFEHQFIDRVNKEVGGDVMGVEELREEGVWTVRRDINVRPTGRLKITPGVTLKFEHSVGMMVSGELIAEGDNSGGQPVLTMLEREPLIKKEELGLFLLSDEEQDINGTSNGTDLAWWDDGVEEDVNMGDSVGVRLVGRGDSPREGRLQVEIDGQWGTVCDFGWTLESAALACQQMGFVLNKEDWKLEASEIPEGGRHAPIMMSNVRCGELDTDLRTCKRAERADDFSNSCTHDYDVGIRCYDVSWAGLRLGMTAKRSKIYDVMIERAGLFDYRTSTFMPGIQADFSHHVFENIVVRDNDYDGIGVIYSDIYYPDHVNFLKKSLVSGNKRHGVSFRQLGMIISDSEIRDNVRAGIYHDPKLTKLEQRELSEWMSLIDESRPGTIVKFPDTSMGSSAEQPIILKEKESTLLMTTEQDHNQTQRRTYYIRAERDEFVIGMQLINPFHNYTSEKLHIYDYTSVVESANIRVLEVSRDIASFPTVSSSYAVTMVFDTGDSPLGHMMLLLTPINCANLPGNCNPSAWHINPLDRNKIYDGPIPRLTVDRSRIASNGQGLMAIHYNRYLGHDSQVYLRKANESVEIFDSEIVNNTEAMFVFTPFRELNQFNISEIRYMVNRTRFAENKGGIFQYSKDLRDSNNIYHWVLRENRFENNDGGGFDVNLPYVWQYDENFTHTVHIDSNNFQSNKDFGITVAGHFARVYIVNNTLLENDCEKGLISLTGMEKECWLFANNIQLNDGIFMLDMNMDSQSAIMGFVAAYITRNIIQKNKHSHHRLGFDTYHPSSYTISVIGVQKFNITSNLLGNQGLDYELLSGVKTARIGNMLNAEQNFWGTSNINLIRERLFDFDDFNSFAVTQFLPYFIENSFDSQLSTSYEKVDQIDLEDLGGRLFESLTLIPRGRPYIIRRDLTIMPEVTLTIEPGVEMEFYPSVGILVLGTLHASGTMSRNIVMRPVSVGNSRNKRETGLTRDGRSKKDFDVRLCQANKDGRVCPPGADQGFLEIYNRTTMQWVPICDNRFSERNAEVICRQLGFSELDVFLDFEQRIEYHENSLKRIIYWPEPYQCTGKEKRLSQCPIRMNGQIYGHKYGCNWKGKDFAFVHCGKRNLEASYEYWGGIRFSVKNFEQELFHDHIHDAVTHSSVKHHESVLQYVNIVGAGILHNEKSPAIQSFMKAPLISTVNISKSAYDGINIISPPKTVNLLYNKVENNLGTGVSVAMLSGENREGDRSSFAPLKEAPVPYNTFGMIDICDPHKEIIIEERVLVYYKYDNNPVDCVKIFASVYDVKPIGFRLLQYNLVNSSGEPWMADQLTLYDGDIYNYTTLPMATIKVDDQDLHQRLWKTSKTNAMSIRFHATGARPSLGFIAEVVTLPVPFVNNDRYIMHNISFSVIQNNRRGAVKYTSAGEMNPIVTMARNQFTDNCQDLYGNFSSCQSAVFLDIQNTRDVFFHNNYVANNIGGLFVRSGSSGSATAMKGVLHNNVFVSNTKKVVLHIEGRTTSPYQDLKMYRNYMTRNNVSHEAVIKMDQVVCNASFNTFFNNRGKVIMEIGGFDNVRLPIYQRFTHNGFHNNFAYGKHCDRTTLNRCQWGSRATVLAGSAGQEYVDNIFYNLDNDYELVTLNRSVFDVWKTPINAKYNYWGYNETYAVAGRIKDLHDEDGLLEVDFTPFQMNNRTLMSGKCHPGWQLVGNTCFMYHGAPMSFTEAKEFCAKDNASMPYLMDRYYEIHRFLETQQADWRYYDMAWVQHLDSPSHECTAFVDSGVDSVSCDFLLPTLCELDPHVNPGFSLHHLEDYVTIGALCTGIGLVLLVTLVCLLWCTKNRARKKERFERRNSIRLSKSSLGSRSLASMQSAGFSDINYRRRMVGSQSNSRQPSIVTSNPYGDYYGDTMEKRALQETTNRPYDVYNTGLGAHMSPGSSNFVDMHDVHYAPGAGNVAATVHIPPANYEGFENRAYRPETRQSQLAQEDSQTSLWQNQEHLPGYSSNVTLANNRTGDSVLDFKRDMAEQMATQDGDSTGASDTQTGSTGTSDQEYQTMDQEYQTMDRPENNYGHSTFRPPSGNYGPQGGTLQLQKPQESIPGVPGYAKPFALPVTEPTTSGISQKPATAYRPFNPPPEPPQSRPRSNQSSRQNIVDLPPAPQETSFDYEPASLPPAPPLTGRPLDQEPQSGQARILRAKSMGEILETNLDDEGESTPVLASQANGHSRSMQLLNSGKLSMNASLLETDM